jgi:DNA-directed RNA polymerase specialized sigma24 family protein
MKRVWELAPPAFEKMLDWLDKDRDIAGQKYEGIRLSLIKILDYRGCLDSEAVADIVFDRVARRIDFLIDGFQGDPALYFFSVARKVFLEYRRQPEMLELPHSISEKNNQNHSEDDIQPEYECLKKCLLTLSNEKRDLIIEYYGNEKKAKAKSHKQFAKNAGIKTKTLHVRAHRVRLFLQKCVLKCLNGENE